MTVGGLSCVSLKKRYPGRDEYALGDESSGIDLQVEKGELFALLGPSGCGKTTTLRIVGGFVAPSSGKVLIAGNDETATPPHKRPTNTVFQNYALFPHYDLASNVGFGLRMSGMRKSDRARKVDEALTLVGLGGFGHQRISELSGGQAQRAALARAMVLDPPVLLLDEPLGALDLKLRKQMQHELVRLRDRTGATFIHVTHDQEEACAIADRIAVMHRGKVLQVDSPAQLYQRPVNSIVSDFINAGTLIRGVSEIGCSTVQVKTPAAVFAGDRPAHLKDGVQASAVLPPHDVRVVASADVEEANGVVGVIERVSFQGEGYELAAKLSDGVVLRARIGTARVRQLGEQLSAGRQVGLSWHPEDVIFVEDLGSPGKHA